MREAGTGGGGAHPIARGTVADGFEEVRLEFERNFAERGEIGAAVAAYWRGEKVVDLWGGRRSPGGELENRAGSPVAARCYTIGAAGTAQSPSTPGGSHATHLSGLQRQHSA